MLLLILHQKMGTVDEKKNDEKRMYENPILEFLSTSGPKTMTTFHLALSSLMFYLGIQFTENLVIWKTTLLFLTGVLTWSLAEYLMHRYVFHFVSENEIIQAVHYAMHGYHHEVPNDMNRLFMPPLPAFLLLAIFFGLFYIFLEEKAWFFTAGFEIGYLLYSLLHYTLHKSVPKNKYLNKLWLHHATHHYKNHEIAFGVSSKFWDRVFRTLPKEELRKR